MAYLCFKCGSELTLSTGGHVGRKDTCPKCNADVHACRNCSHYDRSTYNECRESNADRVLEKDRSNFCDYFKFAPDRKGGGGSDNKNTLKKLDDLFK